MADKSTKSVVIDRQRIKAISNDLYRAICALGASSTHQVARYFNARYYPITAAQRTEAIDLLIIDQKIKFYLKQSKKECNSFEHYVCPYDTIPNDEVLYAPKQSGTRKAKATKTESIKPVVSKPEPVTEAPAKPQAGLFELIGRIIDRHMPTLIQAYNEVREAVTTSGKAMQVTVSS